MLVFMSWIWFNFYRLDRRAICQRPVKVGGNLRVSVEFKTGDVVSLAVPTGRVTSFHCVGLEKYAMGPRPDTPRRPLAKTRSAIVCVEPLAERG